MLVLRVLLWLNVKSQRYCHLKGVQPQFLIIVWHVHKKCLFVRKVKIIIKSIVHQFYLIACLLAKKIGKFSFFPWSPDEVNSFRTIFLVRDCGLFMRSEKPLSIRLLPPAASFDYLSYTAIIIANANAKLKTLDTLGLRLYV